MFDHFFHMSAAPPCWKSRGSRPPQWRRKVRWRRCSVPPSRWLGLRKRWENRGKGGKNGETPWKTGAFHGKMWENLWKSSRNGCFQWFVDGNIICKWRFVIGKNPWNFSRNPMGLRYVLTSKHMGMQHMGIFRVFYLGIHGFKDIIDVH